MHITIITAQAFNELDSFIALGILNRIKKPHWRVSICAPETSITSMNGVTIMAQTRLADARSADVVLFGSGMKTREFVGDDALMRELRLDPERQLIGAQCSGTLVLAKLGLLRDLPACTDLTTKPWVLEAGVQVLNQPFFARGNVATAGGCLSSIYLAAWVIARTEGLDAARSAIHYVAPVGEKDATVERAMAAIERYLPAVTAGAATAGAVTATVHPRAHSQRIE